MVIRDITLMNGGNAIHLNKDAAAIRVRLIIVYLSAIHRECRGVIFEKHIIFRSAQGDASAVIRCILGNDSSVHFHDTIIGNEYAAARGVISSAAEVACPVCGVFADLSSVHDKPAA